ncbi:MAG: DUF1559 domain-containing protein [Pirellulaceae bacterium]|nr:DUF1559 domain-containing protein [Pirellulaceae bacterium]
MNGHGFPAATDMAAGARHVLGGSTGRWAVWCVLGGMLAGTVLGCGSSTVTQADMRRHAIRRSSDKDEEEQAAAVATQPRQDAVDESAGAEAAPDLSSAEASVAGAPSAGAERPAQPTASDSGQRSTMAAQAVPDAPPAPAVATRPAAPLTPVERRQRTLDNLTRLAAAMQAYAEKNRRLFFPAITEAGARPLLSWRVELLPYLGYQQLYDQFHLDEPWDSPHNKQFLPAIPEVYQSPERFDEKTNYVIPLAQFTPYGRRHGFSLQDYEDGAANTVILLEADDTAAVNWTEPADLKLDLSNFSGSVGNLREDGFFVVWGDYTISRIASDCPPASLKAMFTYDGGEKFSSFDVRLEATAEPDVVSEKDAAGARAADIAGSADRDARADRDRTDRPMTAISDTRDSAPRAETRPRYPVPDARSVADAKKLIREIYHKEYEGNKALRERQELAKRMLQQAEQVAQDVAGQYVLLDIAIQIATDANDTPTATKAMDRLTATFSVNEVELWRELLAKLARRDRSDASVRLLLEKSQKTAASAVAADAYDAAEELCQIAIGAARQLRERETLERLEEQLEQIDTARKAHRGVQKTIAALSDHEDPQANLEVGVYYCLVKGEWEKGLPLLAKAGDARYRDLAEAELRRPTIPQDQLNLADGWWELAPRIAKTSDSAPRCGIEKR